jgi:hypothetical protein
MERQKNEMLMKKLRESTRIIKSYETSRTPGELTEAVSRYLSIRGHFIT